MRQTLPLLAAGLLAACAHGPTSTPPAAATPAPTAAAGPASFEADRQAILAMLGEYQVDFHFTETVPLAADYTKHDDKDAGAHEVVVLIADTGEFISLQHILVVGDGDVVKHWRQDWTYQADARWEFTADQTWRMRDLPAAKTAGAWTQCVYEVSDAPRYCGTGDWNHRYGAATWTSDRTWRPLPRREYTKRKDYNALNVENRHTITPAGWTHEQDNTKVVRDGEATERTLVREFGYNEYVRIDDFDFSPAYTYWDATADYWARVRAEWARRIAVNNGIMLATTVDGMAIIGPTFAQAQAVQDGETVTDAEIAEVLDTHTRPPNKAAAASAEQQTATVARGDGAY